MGTTRKGVMLAELQGALRARRRRRTAGRAALIAAVPVLAVGMVLRLIPGDRPDESPTRVLSHTFPAAAVTPADGTPVSPTAPTASSAIAEAPSPTAVAARISLIQTDPTVLTRMTITPPERSIVRVIDDDELIASLAETGRSVGIIRTGGRLVLVSNEPSPDPIPGSDAGGPDAGWGG